MKIIQNSLNLPLSARNGVNPLLAGKKPIVGLCNGYAMAFRNELNP